jgi:hypothetical protein
MGKSSKMREILRENGGFANKRCYKEGKSREGYMGQDRVGEKRDKRTIREARIPIYLGENRGFEGGYGAKLSKMSLFGGGMG